MNFPLSDIYSFCHQADNHDCYVYRHVLIVFSVFKYILILQLLDNYDLYVDNYGLYLRLFMAKRETRIHL